MYSTFTFRRGRFCYFYFQKLHILTLTVQNQNFYVTDPCRWLIRLLFRLKLGRAMLELCHQTSWTNENGKGVTSPLISETKLLGGSERCQVSTVCTHPHNLEKLAYQAKEVKIAVLVNHGRVGPLTKAQDSYHGLSLSCLQSNALKTVWTSDYLFLYKCRPFFALSTNLFHLSPSSF